MISDTKPSSWLDNPEMQNTLVLVFGFSVISKIIILVMKGAVCKIFLLKT